MFAVSMRANYLYGYGIGQSPDTKFAIAWANVAADLWKGFGLIVAAGLWRAKSRRAAIVISLTWLVCLSFSVSSAIGIYVQERTALTSGREAQHAALQDAERELRDIEEKLKRDNVQQTIAQVEASIAAALARPLMVGDRVRGTVGSVSAACSKHDSRTAQACAEVAVLRTDLARAVEATRLQERATVLQQTITSLRDRGGAAAPDPVGEFWAWLTRGFFSVRDVGFGLPLAFALMIEMVSAFGPLGIVAYAEATHAASRPDVSRHAATVRDTSRLPAKPSDGVVPEHVGQLISYIAERTEPTESAAGIGVDELFVDYQAWCRQTKVAPLQLKQFAREFDRLRASPELEGKIKKFGSRYFGIAFAGEEAGAMPRASHENPRPHCRAALHAEAGRGEIFSKWTADGSVAAQRDQEGEVARVMPAGKLLVTETAIAEMLALCRVQSRPGCTSKSRGDRGPMLGTSETERNASALAAANKILRERNGS